MMMTDSPFSGNMPLLYGITDPRYSGHSHFNTVKTLLEGGVRLIQIREKHWTRETLEDVARSVALSRGKNALLIINDRVDIAHAYGAHGVHCGEEDLPPREARKILGRDRIIGISTHSVDSAAASSREDVDYIAIGPIFETRTKQLRREPLGISAIEKARKLVDKPLIAIGGITLDTVPAILAAGADSVAVISDILCADDVRQRVRDYLSVIDSLKRRN